MSNLLAVLGLVRPAQGFSVHEENTPAVGLGDDIPAAALARWRTEQQRVVAALKGLAARAAGSSHHEAKAAFIEIQAVVAQLGGELRSTRQLDELQRWLGDDRVVGDLDELAVPIRAPLLAALAEARTGANR